MDYFFQIELQSILVVENGAFAKEKGNNILTTSLIYPKEGVPSLTTMKELKLVDKQEVSFKNKNLSDRLMFKTSFEGDVSIAVDISSKVKKSVVTKILKGIAKAGLLAGVGLITGGTGVTIMLGAATGLVESVFGIDDAKSKIHSLGRVEWPLNILIEEFEKGNKNEMTLPLQLQVPKQVVFRRFNPEGGSEEIEPMTLPKGANNAMVVLKFIKVPKGTAVIKDQAIS